MKAISHCTPGQGPPSAAGRGPGQGSDLRVHRLPRRRLGSGALEQPGTRIRPYGPVTVEGWSKLQPSASPSLLALNRRGCVQAYPCPRPPKQASFVEAGRPLTASGAWARGTAGGR